MFAGVWILDVNWQQWLFAQVVQRLVLKKPQTSLHQLVKWNLSYLHILAALSSLMHL